ncbi:MAG: phosphoribosylanthranilate isomerase [Acetatifactor sp.]|nr:phosphoribosylanthranilate isomerase [Acetatifactor sp.]
MKIKICGLRRPEDVAYANEVKPDYVGFILTAGFRRSITKEIARELRNELAPGITAVGVFVNEPVEHVVQFLEEGIIDVAQLHGQESEEDIVYVKAATGKPVIKVVRFIKQEDGKVVKSSDVQVGDAEVAKTVKSSDIQAGNQENAKLINRYAVEAWLDSAADYLLFDSGTGTGKTFDWSVLAEVLADYGGTLPKEFFLAGGISTENIGEAYEQVRPYAVDLSSSVETEGVKNLEKMKLAVSAARKAGKN